MVITYMIRVRCVLRGPSYHMTIQQKGVRNIDISWLITLARKLYGQNSQMEVRDIDRI